MHDSLSRTARIVGLGTALPERVLTNQDFERMVETSDEWIVTRTGMKERHVVGEELRPLARVGLQHDRLAFTQHLAAGS